MITFEKIEEHKKAMVKPDGTFSISDQYKLLKLINTYIDQKNFSDEELRKVQYNFYYYCFDDVKSEIVNKSGTDSKISEGQINFKTKIEKTEYLDVYKKLLLLDKKRKTVLWSEKTLCFLNFHDESRKFLKDNSYNTTKLEEESWRYLNKNIISINAAMSENTDDLEKIKNICPNYLKKINWSKIEMNSHTLVLLAIEYEYDLNQKQIQEYFTLIRPNTSVNLEKTVTYFAKILNHSSFFKSNISKSKNLKDSLGKFFGVFMKEVKEYDEDLSPMKKFIFLLAEHPLIKHNDMKNKLEKKEKITYFGKPFLNKKEEEEYLKIKEQRSIQTKTKKTKI